MVGYFDNELVCGWYYFDDCYYGEGHSRKDSD